MVPRTVGSADDRNLAMLADGTFFPGFRLIDLRLDRCTPGSRVLAYVSHGRGGIDGDNLVDHFDHAAVSQFLQRLGNPVRPHHRAKKLVLVHTRQM